MNNDSNMFLRGMHQGPTDMGMYMTNANNRYNMVNYQNEAPITQESKMNVQNFLSRQLQGLNVSNRNMSMPSIRTMVPNGGSDGMMANDISSVDNSVMQQHSGGIVMGSNGNHGGSPGNLSPNISRRPPISTSAGGQVSGSGPGMRLRTNDNQTMFYSSGNLESTKKLQESGCLEAPSWYLYPAAPVSAPHLRNGRHHLTKRKERNSFFIDPELRQMFLNRIRACLLTPDEGLQSSVPKVVSFYKELTPLENPTQPRTSVSFGCPSLCYKAFSTRDNKVVLLRRFMGVTIPPPEAAYTLGKIRDAQQPNLIPIRDMFSTEAFGGISLVFVLDYYPCSTSLLQTHMHDPMKLNGFASPFNVDRVARPHSSNKSAADLNMLPEPTAWNYLIQLIHMIRYVHKVLQKSCRIIDPSKVLVQDGQRVRLNCFGIADMLSFQSHMSNEEMTDEISHSQRSDLVSLGKLMLSVTCGTAVALQDTQLVTSLDLISRLYRPDFSSVVRGLVLSEMTSVDQLITATAAQCYEHLQVAYSHNDFLERQLMREMESGRLFRLSCKLQSICERNELGAEQDWSETEDRYMLKLFRDFVFHQTDENGAPWIDLAHIVSCLNKLDAGSPEKVCLMSRDSQNVLIVSYSDVKRWLDESFAYLVERQQASLQHQQQQVAAAYYPQQQQQTEFSMPGQLQ